VRRAHWHHFRANKGLVLHWLPPILVNAKNADDVITTEHQVDRNKGEKKMLKIHRLRKSKTERWSDGAICSVVWEWDVINTENKVTHKFRASTDGGRSEYKFDKGWVVMDNSSQYVGVFNAKHMRELLIKDIERGEYQ
jgi:hypothetical protein